MSVVEEAINTTFKSHRIKFRWLLNDWTLSRQYHGAQCKNLTSPTFESLHCKWEMELNFNFPNAESKLAHQMRVCLYLKDCDVKPSSVVLQGSIGIQRPGTWLVETKLFGVLPVCESRYSNYWTIDPSVENIEVVADLNIFVGDPYTAMTSKSSKSNFQAEDESQQALQLSEAFEGMLHDTSLCDFKLYVGDDNIEIHKAIFAARSPVFKNKFEELKDKRKSDLDVECSNIDTLTEFKHFIYTGRISVDDEEMLTMSGDLFQLAGNYKIDSLTTHLVTRLHGMLTTDNVTKILEIASDHHLSTLQEAGKQLLKKNIAIFRTEKKDELVMCLQKNTDIATFLLDDTITA